MCLVVIFLYQIKIKLKNYHGNVNRLLRLIFGGATVG